jgi:hypothetical protein
MDVHHWARKGSPKYTGKVVGRCETDHHDSHQQNGDGEEELPVILAPRQLLRKIGWNLFDCGHVFLSNGGDVFTLRIGGTARAMRRSLCDDVQDR